MARQRRLQMRLPRAAAHDRMVVPPLYIERQLAPKAPILLLEFSRPSNVPNDNVSCYRVAARAVHAPTHESARKSREVHRFDKVIVETSGLRPLVIFRPAVAGQGDEANLIELRHRPKPPRELITIHLRKADVEHRDLGTEGLESLESVFATVDHFGCVTLERQEHREGVGGIHIVINDEYPTGLRLAVLCRILQLVPWVAQSAAAGSRRLSRRPVRHSRH